MSAIDLSNLLKLMQEFEQNGKGMPYWLADAVNKAKMEYKQEAFAQQRMMAEDLARVNQSFNNRINSLFDSFDLPEDFIKYKTPQLESKLDSTKQNIKQFASDMHRLSELAGGSPLLEEKAVKITSNLLERLKNDLELTPQEKKQLEGKTFEEVAEYYSQTRSGNMDKLNKSIDNYRQELHQLENLCQGKSQEEINRLYEEKLLMLEKATGQGKEEYSKVENRLSKYEASIDNIKSPPQTSQTISDKQLEQIINEKSAFNSPLFN
jgi:hypothetical protein